MTSDGRRGKRVAELMRAYLAELMRREVDDPRLAAVVITTVEVTDDLMSARIGVRLLVGDEDPKTRAVVMKSLAKGAGSIAALDRAATRIASLAGTALSLRRRARCFPPRGRALARNQGARAKPACQATSPISRLPTRLRSKRKRSERMKKPAGHDNSPNRPISTARLKRADGRSTLVDRESKSF